ncbi:MAG: DNA primase [Pseudomonadota bacterium]
MGGRIPREFIDNLVQRVDIVDVINARVALKKAGANYMACCPFHSEKTPSFTVSPSKQFYHCFGCGAHGTAISFLMNYERLEFIDAVKELAREAGVELPRESHTPRQDGVDPAALYELLERCAVYYKRQLREHPERKRAVDYFKGRGVSGTIAAEFELGYAPEGWDHLAAALGRDTHTTQLLVQAGMWILREGKGGYDRFRERVMFPIRDYRGRVVGFGGRVLDDSTPKYLNSPETPVFHKGQELYGLYQARRALNPLPRVLIVEGYMDVVALHQHDVRYAVATLGTAMTPHHLERVLRYCRDVVFCFDGDRAGRQAAWRALENALPYGRDGVRFSFVFLPEGEDPDSLVRRIGATAFNALVDKATPLSTFFFENLSLEADIRSMDGQARMVERARPLLAKLPEGALRLMMLERLAEWVKLDAHVLMPHLAAPATVRHPKPAARSMRGAHHVASPVRRLIALLLQQPALAQQVAQPERFGALSEPGVRLLQQLLEFLNNKPHITLAGILEHWRGSEDYAHLLRIVEEDVLLPAAGLETEFQASVRRLEAWLIEQQVEQLLSKSRYSRLDEQEMVRLKDLLHRQHEQGVLSVEEPTSSKNAYN